ncbi:MAG: methylated-DNA--[protein]-cysteine S-methyltransferase [Halobacteriota archaeon]|nr:methylated-DNA--[protein]-cysteine S-methyltransferase [Halobacteriota archaeon]
MAYFEYIEKYVIVISDEEELKRVSMADSPPETHLNSIGIIKDLKRYFEGLTVDFTRYNVNLSGLSDFERTILNETRAIPYGATTTYSELAEKVGRKKAARAVGNALGKNPLPIVIPCHRVVGKHGIGGYSSGKDIKEKLLKLEGVLL